MSDNSAAVHIAQMLEESAIGYSIGIDLFVSKEPSSPNEVITLYDDSAEKPSNVMSADKMYEYVMIQIIVRRESYRTAMDDIYSIISHLDFRVGDVKDGYTYTGIILNSGPALMDYDERNRPRVSANFRVQRYS